MATPTGRTTTALGNADRLRGALGLVFGELVRSGGRLVGHSRIRELYPEYLAMIHSVIRTSVPLMEAVRERALALAAEDAVAAEMADYLVEHIEEERDHDEWLLQDLEAIGVERSALLARVPSPTVASVVGAQYYWGLHVHPVAILGWIGLLEGYPPELALIEELEARTGYPPEAFRTLREHAELDIAHGAELFEFLDRLPLTEEQAAVIGVSGMWSIHLLARALDEVTDRAAVA
jgi:hypothetical protein